MKQGSVKLKTEPLGLLNLFKTLSVVGKLNPENVKRKLSFELIGMIRKVRPNVKSSMNLCIESINFQLRTMFMQSMRRKRDFVGFFEESSF